MRRAAAPAAVRDRSGGSRSGSGRPPAMPSSMAGPLLCLDTVGRQPASIQGDGLLTLIMSLLSLPACDKGGNRSVMATSCSGTTWASPPSATASANRPTPTPPSRSPHDRHRPPRRPDRRCRLLRRPGPVPAHGRAGPRPGPRRPEARTGRGADRRRDPGRGGGGRPGPERARRRRAPGRRRAGALRAHRLGHGLLRDDRGRPVPRLVGRGPAHGGQGLHGGALPVPAGGGPGHGRAGRGPGPGHHQRLGRQAHARRAAVLLGPGGGARCS